MNRGLVPDDFPAAQVIEQVRERAARDGIWREHAVAAGRAIFDPDTAQRDVFVLVGGLVKLSYLSANGTEAIKSFVVDEGIFGREEGGVDFGACAVEPSRVVRLPEQWVVRQTDASAGLRQSYTLFVNWLRQRKAERERMLLCLTAGERLLQFLEAEGDLVRRLPQGDIARYLGITPIAFSRLKRRLGVGAAVVGNPACFAPTGAKRGKSPGI